MKTIFEILSVVLALAMVASAVADFRGVEQIKELMHRLQYRPGFERFLGAIKLVGALGLFIGLGVSGLGIAASIGFVIYFVLAVRAHLSIGDTMKDAGPAVGLLVLSILTAVTGLAS